jgi:hypothetical protein
VLRKYNSATHAYTTVSGATITHAVTGGQNVVKVSYQVTDGGALDEDGTANGNRRPGRTGVTTLTDTNLNLAATSTLAGSLIVAAAGTSYASGRKVTQRLK